MWSLSDAKSGEVLKPIKFTNGKNQEEVVKEVVDFINKGAKVVFIRGMCGTGKSAIALHICKELGRGSIVVPVKNLQKQYQTDYLEKKYILNGEKRMTIKVLTGRKNHECLYLKDKQDVPKPKFSNPLLQFDDRGRVNAKLDIFDKPKTVSEPVSDYSAANFLLPCTIEIKERNRDKLREYLLENPLVKKEDFESVEELSRFSVAAACPYWSPILPVHIELKALVDAKKEHYTGLNGQEYCIHRRKEGCKYYEQFLSYQNADALVFNSHKYLIENAMNRKPETDVEIIDECDEFLDSFSNEEHINLNKFINAVATLHKKLAKMLEGEKASVTKEMETTLFSMIGDVKFGNIEHLKNSKIGELVKLMTGNSEIFEDIDEEEHNYLTHCFKVAKVFEHFIDEAYYSYKKIGSDPYVTIVTIDLARMFGELLDKNKSIVLMSGTLHEERVLKDVFGLKDFKVVEAETAVQGSVEIVRTGLEFDCKYDNFRNGNHTREEYLIALSRCVSVAKRPTLIHVNSFFDLPTEQEKEHYQLSNLVTQQELRSVQEQYREDELVVEFKSGKKDVLFSTKCNRGIDFPGEMCNSIIITKYPYPDVKSLFWEILKRNKPQYYWEFYKDKARRELLQRVYRGLRSKDDRVQLLSPDIRVLQEEIK